MRVQPRPAHLSPNPIFEAINAKADHLEDEADHLSALGNIAGAVKDLKEAIGVARGYPPLVARAAAMLADVLQKAGRDEEALDAYRQCFFWDSRNGDLREGASTAPEYALLLSKMGKVEEAKAMYYWMLRHFNSGAETRYLEPVPFLVVFDPDPNAVVWDYTPDRFRAAVLMLSQVGHEDPKVMDEIRKLAPDWFWPVAYLADKTDPDSDPVGGPEYVAKRHELIEEADRLAKPGIERDLMAWYHQLILTAPSARSDFKPGTLERRPMTEGNTRRALIEVLKPNEELLKKLSTPYPNEPKK